MHAATHPLGRQVRRFAARSWAREARDLAESGTPRDSLRLRALRFMLGRYPQATWEPKNQAPILPRGPSREAYVLPPGRRVAISNGLSRIGANAEGSRERLLARDSGDALLDELLHRVLVDVIFVASGLPIGALIGTMIAALT